ncbi:MAG: hypothetical protein ACO3YQ_07555 [Flavobacteriales bacterium]|jgi:hypothetical protein
MAHGTPRFSASDRLLDALMAPEVRPLPRAQSIRNVLAYSAACTMLPGSSVDLPIIGN